MTQQVIFHNFGSNRGNLSYSSSSIFSAKKKAEEATTQPAVSFSAPPSRLYTDQVGKTASTSSNNKINGRRNEVRLDERIPDIYGKVLSVPDILCKPYIAIENDDELYEINYFCVGRGSHTVTEVKHDGTPITDLGGEYDVYGPDTSPMTSTGTIGLTFLPPIDSVGVKTNDLPAALVLRPGNSSYVLDAQDGDDEGLVYVRGPYIFENCEGVLVNLACGALTASSGDYVNPAITIRVRCQLVNESDVPFGTEYSGTYTFTAFTNDALAYVRYYSFFFTPPVTGRMQVKVDRTTNYAGHESDILHRRAYLSGLYGYLEMEGKTSFGDVTTIRTKIPTGIDVNSGSGSSFYKTTSRHENTTSLTCIAHRKVDGVASSNFADIAEAVCLDAKIGNRTADEIDTVSLGEVDTAVQAHFGTSVAAEFNHTFDDTDTSFEETLFTICHAAFVTPYREGNVIKFKFDNGEQLSRLLFNHRNKLPNSETRSVTFGYFGDKQGVEYEYNENETGLKRIFRLPLSGTVPSYETAGPVGITNKLQAYFHAYRQFNVQKYQNTVVEFDATQEANLLIVKDKINIADNTRSDTFDGEILAKNDLILNLSQPVNFGPTGTIFVQTVTGDVESRTVYPIPGFEYQVMLESDFIGELSLGSTAFARSTYEIVPTGSVRRGPFIVQELSPQDNMITRVIAVNFDERIYANDTDYIDLVVDINGDLL